MNPCLSTPQLVAACAKLEADQLDRPATAMRYTLAAMGNRWLQLHKEIEAHTRHLTTLTCEAAPELGQVVKPNDIGSIEAATARQMLPFCEW